MHKVSLILLAETKIQKHVIVQPFYKTKCTDQKNRNWCSLNHIWWIVYAFGCYAFLRWCSTCSWECVSPSLGQTNSYTSQPKTNKQILFVSGLTLIIGPQKTFYFFARKQKLRGTVCFIGGILLVFFKWPFIGMLIETFGFLNLFGYAVHL